MPCSVPSPQPRNPLRTYQFHIYLGPKADARKAVGGVQRVSGLSTNVTAYEIWEGGNNLHRYAHPDKTNWDPVTLEQGLALDSSLEDWADGVRHFSKTGKLLTKDGKVVPVKRNVTIELHDPVLWQGGPAQGALAQPPRCREYTLFNAWISKYTALPKLDAMASEVAIMLVELVHEGWTMKPLPVEGHVSQLSQPTQ